ncbi:MAG: hypothetical protein PVJ52_01675 [Candidatus Woesebacteria bacterium]|jgi:hypothetical protein
MAVRSERELDCSIDPFYPKCEECKPRSKDVCPLYGTSVNQRFRTGKRWDRLQGVLGTDIDYVHPKRKKFTDEPIKGYKNPASKKNTPEEPFGQGKPPYP